MDKIIECLSASKLFSNFKRESFLAIYPLLGVRTFAHKKDEVLLHKDDIANFVGILISGDLAVIAEDVYGASHLIRKVLPLEIYAADIACTPSQISPYSITCTSDCLAATIPFHILSKKSALLDEHRCSILCNMLSFLSYDNMRQFYKTQILSTNSLRERIILYLSHQSKRSSSLSFKISFNREEMAAYLCVDRSALSRELSRMRSEGLIKFNKSEFEISPEL